MRRVRVIHWRPEEAEALIEACRAGGFEVEFSEDTHGPSVCRSIREGQPDAVAIDLSRVPSSGRMLAEWICETKATRAIPVVFVNGEEPKVAKVRDVFPDAAFATTATVVKALHAAGALAGPKLPVKAAAEKLGIRSGTTVGVMDAPRDYLAVLGELPEDVEMVEEARTNLDVMLWFVRDAESLDRALRRPGGKMWIVWRKGGAVKPDAIRMAATDRALVDYKICSLDGRWSGILLGRKRS